VHSQLTQLFLEYWSLLLNCCIGGVGRETEAVKAEWQGDVLHLLARCMVFSRLWNDLITCRAGRKTLLTHSLTHIIIIIVISSKCRHVYSVPVLFLLLFLVSLQKENLLSKCSTSVFPTYWGTHLALVRLNSYYFCKLCELSNKYWAQDGLVV